MSNWNEESLGIDKNFIITKLDLYLTVDQMYEIYLRMKFSLTGHMELKLHKTTRQENKSARESVMCYGLFREEYM